LVMPSSFQESDRMLLDVRSVAIGRVFASNLQHV
jgi:hypothetical protein